jgi:Protein of unknown function (DUF4236)
MIDHAIRPAICNASAIRLSLIAKVDGMGFRFSKSKSFGKIFRLTVSKGGVSASVGVPGYRKTFSKRGVTTTVSVPHTGLLHSSTVKYPPPKRVAQPMARPLAQTLPPVLTAPQPLAQISVQPIAQSPPLTAAASPPAKSAGGSKIALFIGLGICAYLLLHAF